MFKPCEAWNAGEEVILWTDFSVDLKRFLIRAMQFWAELTIFIIVKQKNLFWLGEKKYQTLPQYLYFADVCIVPFKINPLTIAADPIKTYEYLSTGKPIVSTNLPEVKKIASKPIIYLTKSRETFLEYIDLALNTEISKKTINFRLQIAFENSWQTKSKQIENIISQFFKKKNRGYERNKM